MLNVLKKLLVLFLFVFCLENTIFNESEESCTVKASEESCTVKASEESCTVKASEESWYDFLNRNKYKILGVSFVGLTLILIVNYYHAPSSSCPPPEIFKDLMMIKEHLPEHQYETILDLVEEIFNDFEGDSNEVVQYAIIKFLEVLSERGKNTYISKELINYFEKED